MTLAIVHRSDPRFGAELDPELSADLDLDSDPDQEQPAGRVLDALREAISPVTLTGERLLPVPADFTSLFPERGMVRGRTITCTGEGAMTLALALVAPAIVAGSWLAIIDLPTVGLDAAHELGIPLERVVAVHAGDGAERSRRWPEVVAAAADGFDVILAAVPAGIHPSVARTLSTRIRRREAVVLLVDPTGGEMAGGETTSGLPSDGELRVRTTAWHGIGDGHGRLNRRQLSVQATGRRIPGRRSCQLALPA